MKRSALALAVLAALSSGNVLARTYHHQHHRTHHHVYYGPRSGPHYTNVNGNYVHSPMHSSHRPHGATARCSDGTWSFSRHRRGTCSHHGGIG